MTPYSHPTHRLFLPHRRRKELYRSGSAQVESLGLLLNGSPGWKMVLTYGPNHPGTAGGEAGSLENKRIESTRCAREFSSSGPQIGGA
jgi:hypothetical protein